MPNNYYALLGVPPTATEQEIRQAFIRQALTCHPDKIAGKEEEFKALNEAREILLDPISRRAYDAELFVPTSVSKNQKTTHEPRREEEERKFFVDPDKDFIQAYDELQQKAENFRRGMYGWRGDFIDELADKLNPDSRASFRKNLYGPEFPSPSLLKRFKSYFGQLARPYKAYNRFEFNFYRDLLQPVKGLGFLLAASLMAVLVPLIIPLLLTSAAVYYFNLSNKNIFKDLASNIKKIPSVITTILGYTVVGIAKLVMTPFTWLIIAPLRGLRTFSEGSEMLEASRGMQRALKETQIGLEQGDKAMLRVTTALLHMKFENSVYRTNLNSHRTTLFSKNAKNHTIRARHSHLSQELEKELFNKLEKQFVLGSLNWHSKKPITENQKNLVQDYINFFASSRLSAPTQPIASSRKQNRCFY